MRPIPNTDRRGYRNSTSETIGDTGHANEESPGATTLVEQRPRGAAHLGSSSHTPHRQKHAKRLSKHSHQTTHVQSRLLAEYQNANHEASSILGSNVSSASSSTSTPSTTSAALATASAASTSGYQSNSSILSSVESTSQAVVSTSTILSNYSVTATASRLSTTVGPFATSNGTSISTSSSENSLIGAILSFASYAATASSTLATTSRASNATFSAISSASSSTASVGSPALSITASSSSSSVSTRVTAVSNLSSTASTVAAPSTDSSSFTAPATTNLIILPVTTSGSLTAYTTISQQIVTPSSQQTVTPSSQQTVTPSSQQNVTPSSLQTVTPSSQIPTTFSTSITSYSKSPSQSSTNGVFSTAHHITSTSQFSSAGSMTSSSGTSSSTAGTSGSSLTTATDARTSSGTIAGSVVGGLAGLSALVLLALALLRWWKRRPSPGVQALDVGRPTTADTTVNRPFLGASATNFMNRLSLGSSVSRPLSDPPLSAGMATNERSFQRLSGRKLPSQWSPGMEGPGPEMRQMPPMSGVNPAYASGSSLSPSGVPSSIAMEDPFADPVVPIIVGGGLAAGAGRMRGEANETIMPSPARTPLFNTGEAFDRTSHLATPGRVTLGVGGRSSSLGEPVFGAGSPSRPGTRDSRFKEDIS